MALNLEKHAQEGNEFVKRLALHLGHPDEINRTGIILRSVMHTFRDRITISESLNLLSQLPFFLKAIYVEGWKYTEKPKSYSTLEEFKNEVKKHQAQAGETEFDWEKPTDEIARIVIQELSRYISVGEAKDIMAQLPVELEVFFKESVENN